MSGASTVDLIYIACDTPIIIRLSRIIHYYLFANIKIIYPHA